MDRQTGIRPDSRPYEENGELEKLMMPRPTLPSVICDACRILISRAVMGSINRQKPAIHRIETHMDDLKAKGCVMCQIFWLILKGNGRIIIDQVLKYQSQGLDRGFHYTEDGLTDIEEIMHTRSKVSFSILGYLEFLAQNQFTSKLISYKMHTSALACLT
ncbi:hypothetical protein BS50DRAFT_626367 [Corynespora cassiicola Philippines]|uniref:Uncharacterized protein n=1 Tax=Corynespora cassiicola Philippines TaxID=1448308 RepID=A0A2T2N4B9_CORCC|nr:hypothetical protein BS50DRAFT_626367 [Corynespora cassiicola Philippines]